MNEARKAEADYFSHARSFLKSDVCKMVVERGQTMTNRERLEKMSDEELAEWLCSQHMDCNACAKKSTCNGWQMDGFYNWLREENNE